MNGSSSPSAASPVIPVALIGMSFLALTASVVGGTSTKAAAGILIAVTLLAVALRSAYVGWDRLIGALILVILFIPIRRYTLPANLPFQLEPYRLLVMVLVLIWVASLLVDGRLRLRKSGFEGPLLVIVGSAFASVLANPSRVAGVSSDVNKSLMFLLSFVLVLYLLVSTIRRLADIDHLAKVLVSGGAVVSVFAIIEARTGFNAFNHLHTILPILHGGQLSGPEFIRYGSASKRVFASAQHPIALSAALVMLVPLAIYLARRYRQRRWTACAALIGIACASTVSRTAIIMFAVLAVVFLWLRPQQTRRLWPALLPMLLAIHFVLPGTLGSLKNSFLPKGGLIAEQQSGGNLAGSGRLAKVGPGIQRWKQEPLVGQGYGTQIVNLDAAGVNSNFFDDQWLGTLIGTGILGFFGWLWLFVRAVRRFGKEAKTDDSDRGWLLAAICAGIAAYGVGMLTYDAFAFIQVTFLLFLFIALGSALLAERPTPLAVRAQRDGA